MTSFAPLPVYMFPLRFFYPLFLLQRFINLFRISLNDGIDNRPDHQITDNEYSRKYNDRNDPLLPPAIDQIYGKIADV